MASLNLSASPTQDQTPLAGMITPQPKFKTSTLKKVRDHFVEEEAARSEAVSQGQTRQKQALQDQKPPVSILEILEQYPHAHALLAGLLEGSPYLWRLIVRWPHHLPFLLTTPPEISFNAVLTKMREAASQEHEAAALMRCLREAKAQAALLIAFCDLGSVWKMEKVTEHLAEFSDVAVRAALRFGLLEAARAGQWVPPHPENPEADLGLFVLALGKHGACELNYSSDIDLSIFYDPRCAGLACCADPQSFAVKLVKGIVKLLNERTADGYVARVDLRLRPDPGLTPIAMPVEAALDYYESVGQNWERAAMIKARPIAGDLAAGERFLKELTPFIWRKYFDYAAIADIHAMKRQIYAARGHAEIAILGHDVKLGRGGIREIEFFVQTQQLVYGGRRPVLRGSRTLDMLPALLAEGWINHKAAQELSEAYRFLRNLEHRIQMVHDEQTQKLPKSEEEFLSLARLSGFTRVGLEKALIKAMKTVENHYAQLFETVPGMEKNSLASSVGSLVFTGVEDDPETLETLRRLGFLRPELVAETVRGWHFGRRPAVTTARAREIVTELVPSLLEAFGLSSDPDGALIAFDHALQYMPAAVELFFILKNNQELRRLFAEILGTAPRLSAFVTQTPHLLDVLVDPDFTGGMGEEATHQRIATRLEREANYEVFLDRARELAKAERFLLGTRVLSRVLPLEEAGHAHTMVAEIFVRLVLSRVCAEFAKNNGEIAGSSLVILAYGKAGSREMGANSDLDLVVVYDAPPEAVSDGARGLSASEYYAKLTQRLVAALASPMHNGTLYEIDLRLRPSGRKGTVATSFTSFVDYHHNEAETWEKMALSRARVMAGDPILAAKINATMREILTKERVEKKLKQDVAAMRGLMQQEKPGKDCFDVKNTAGGLVDIEFIAQTLLLLHAHAHPHLIGKTTPDILREIGKLGLLELGEVEVLLEGLSLQSGFMQTSRLCLPHAFDEKTENTSFKRLLASLLNYPDFAFFVNELKDAQKRIRKIFEKRIGKVK